MKPSVTNLSERRFRQTACSFRPRHHWTGIAGERRTGRTAAAAASLLLTVVLFTGASRAEAAAPAPEPAPAAAFNALKYMPSSVSMYFQLDLQATERYLDSMKGTRLGRDVQTMIADAKDPNIKNLKTVQAMMKGIGPAVSVGVRLPPPPAAGAQGAAAANDPDLLGVLQISDPAAVKAEAELAANLAGAQGGIAWNTENEGDTVIHVGVETPKPGVTNTPPQQVAYALLPDALLISNSVGLLRESVRLAAAAGPGLGDSPDLQALEPRIAPNRMLWGYLDYPKVMKLIMDASAGFGRAAAGGAKGGAQAPPFDPAKLPAFTQMTDAIRGAVFSLSLYPDRAELQGVSAVDPNSDFGKATLAFQGSPVKAPELAFSHSLFFMDWTDMPHMAQIWDHFMQPMMTAVMTSAAGKDNKGAAKAFADTALPMLDDIVNGSGNEIALAIAPPIAGTKTPAGVFLIQKSDNPRLKKGLHELMDAFTGLSGQKWFMKDVLGTPVMVLGAEQSPIRPVYAPVGDFHVFAMDLGSLKTPLYLNEAEAGGAAGNSLAANPGFKKALGLAGPQPYGLFYLDLHSVINMAGGAGALQTAAAAHTGAARPKAGDAANQRVAGDLARAAGQVAIGEYPDPAGAGWKVVLTFDPNAGGP